MIEFTHVRDTRPLEQSQKSRSGGRKRKSLPLFVAACLFPSLNVGIYNLFVLFLSSTVFSLVSQWIGEVESKQSDYPNVVKYGRGPTATYISIERTDNSIRKAESRSWNIFKVFILPLSLRPIHIM